jgi:hypothetical protein
MCCSDTGLRNVSAVDFQGAPKSGVFVQGRNPLLAAAGMKVLDIFVALDAKQVNTFPEYDFDCGLTKLEDMEKERPRFAGIVGDKLPD